jgi:hypothetical protein
MSQRKTDNWVIQTVNKGMNIYKSSIGPNGCPLASGNLRDNAIYEQVLPSLKGFSAAAEVFDVSVAKYIPFLEEGTNPHDIPRAFGYAWPFGIGGRFAGFFHPGSRKRVGFISRDAYYVMYQTALAELPKLGAKKLRVI